MTPKVSICMPNYNFAQYLPEAIESVLRQTYRDFELLITDNCSTDNSVGVVTRYAAQDARIRILVNEHNIGPVNNLNLCLQEARGEYIKFLFSDDLLASEDALERMVLILDADASISLVASARYIINSDSDIIKLWSEYRGITRCAGSKIIQDCLFEQKNRIGEPSVVLFRRKQARRGFDVRYKQAVDLEMWFHLLEQGNFAYINEPLCAFRIHERQQTNINIHNRNLNLLEEPFLLLSTYADKPYINLPRVLRGYMRYVPVYSIWKLYKHERITRQSAVDGIRERYSLRKFVAYYPLFKFYRFAKRSYSETRIALAGISRKRRRTLQPAGKISAAAHNLRQQQPYYEYTRTEICDLLPETLDSVLEIGCGTGNTLLWIKNRKKCAWAGGTEIASEAASIARGRLDALYTENVEHDDLPLQESSIDLILCLDVLEHMADPWTALRRIYKLIKPGGALIVSIPNVRNRKVLFPLLFKGRWNYADAGILDRDHLRFFVRDTAIELIESSGLQVDMVASTGLGRSWRSRIFNNMLPSLIKSLFEKQYLIRGMKK